MYVKSMMAVVALGISSVAWGAEAQKPALVYELTVDGQTYEIVDSVPGELSIEGKTVRISVRIKPIQHYSTGVLEFDYDKSLSLRDDMDKEGRTVNLVHGSAASVVVMQLGDASTDKTTLAGLAQRMETRFKRGTAKDLEKSPESPVEFKGAKGSTLTITYKDEDDDLQTCKIYALESKSQRFAVIVQYSDEEKKVAEPMSKITLESIAAK
jgi:hypothetical protein